MGQSQRQAKLSLLPHTYDLKLRVWSDGSFPALPTALYLGVLTRSSFVSI